MLILIYLIFKLTFYYKDVKNTLKNNTYDHIICIHSTGIFFNILTRDLHKTAPYAPPPRSPFPYY